MQGKAMLENLESKLKFYSYRWSDCVIEIAEIMLGMNVKHGKSAGGACKNTLESDSMGVAFT